MLTGLGGNILVNSTDWGQVLVDSGAAEFTSALLSALKELPGGGEVQTIFNTHWHLDQVGSNAVFGRTGTTIVAHEKTRTHLATDYYLQQEERYQKALSYEAQPTETFFTNGEMTVGTELVEYGHLLQAHTDGDIYVFFHKANVLAVGDAVSPVRDPMLDWFGGGWLGGRVEAQGKLLGIIDAETRVVPSYGPVISRAEVQTEYDMMRELYDRMLNYIKKGMSAERILAEGGMDGLGRSFDDPLKFLYDAHKGYWAHHNSIAPEIL
jgi:glyoxylase-like metal-dependent hydrolase (beta-lactamase superfamily II)